MRPLLRPGLQVLRRDLHTVQLGLDWPGLTVLRDSPALQAVLAAADGFRTIEEVVAHAVTQHLEVTEAVAAEALDALFRCGALVDQAATLRDDVGESAWAFLWLLAGPQGRPATMLRRRRGCVVAVCGSGRVADEVRRVLAGSDLGSIGIDASAADLVVVASDTEPDRESGDLAMHLSTPHLWVWVRELVGVVGPLVEPGLTACLRCVDQWLAEHDPGWPTLVLAAAARPVVRPACDPVLATLVAAFAVHEVAVWATGLRTHTSGRVLEIPHGCGDVAAAAYPLHPRCGCGWQTRHETMGA